MGIEVVREKLSGAYQGVRNWNARRWHFPDVHDNPYFKLIASIITRIGFFAKFILYASMSIIAMIAASGVYDRAEGPETVLGRLATTLGKWVIGFFVAGLFCYSAFAFLYSIFDFDRLGHHSAFPVLARFGRIFSAGFYAFIGIAGLQLLADVRRTEGGSTGIGEFLFSSTGGKGLVVFLGIVFCIVAIVYLSYLINPAKFRKELASERMPPWLFHACIVVARVGAIGRILFFGSFGVVLIDAVANNRGSLVSGTSIIGFEGVLQKVAEFSSALLFIIGAFLFVYALWAFILCLFRRLPAHYNEAEALAALGMRWRAKKAKKEMVHQKNATPVEMCDFATVIDIPSEVPIAEIKQENNIQQSAVAPVEEIIASPLIMKKGEEEESIETIEKIEALPSSLPFYTYPVQSHGSPAGFATR